jgi:peptidoglycan/xylan/chitin deacetylase (PgdA/CDA1 family)
MKSAIKRAVKHTVAMLSHAGAPAARVLTYHSVGDRRHDMNVTLRDFETQMAWLAAHAEVITLEDAAAGRPGIAITLDDGYEDNLLNAAPVLQRHGFPATLFLVTGRTGQCLDDEPDPDRGRIMDRTQAREWLDRGFALGGHTRTHPRLSQLDRVAQRDEIAGCKRDIEEALGIEVPHFAYPYGSAWDYNPDSVALAQEAGYRAAFSNRYGVCTPTDGPYAYRRIWIDASDSLAHFAAKASGRLDALRFLDEPAALALRKGLNKVRP